MSMGEHSRGAGAHHLTASASRVPRRTDGKQTPLWGRQVNALGQSPLSSSLSGAIEVEDNPSIPLSIPQTAHAFGWSGASERILQEDRSQGFHRRRVHCRKEATERGTMRQLAAPEQGHKWGGKWLQTRVLGCQCRFTAQSIADEHNDKVDSLKGAEAFAGKANLLGDFGK
jgi:hypothetical protein